MLVFGKALLSPSLLYATSRFVTTQNSFPFPSEPNSAYYDDLINAAGREKDLIAIQHLLNKRVRDGCFNTNNTFKFISTQIDLSLLDQLLQTLSRLDKGFPRKNAYDSLVARLSKLHRTDHALRVVDAMAQTANAATFHPILSALTRKKNMEEAWRVMDLMREKGVGPDLTAYNYLLTAYCFSGDLTSAGTVMTRIQNDGLGADTRTYDALVLGACRGGKVEGALVLLRRMVDDGVPLLYSTHAHVIGTLLKLGCYTQACEFVLSYGGRDKGLDTESFGLLASRFIDLKKFDKAKLVLEEMRKRGLTMGVKLKDFCQSHLQS